LSDQITTEKLKYKNVSQPKDNLKNSDVPIIESFHLQNQVKSYLSLSSNINDGDCNGQIITTKSSFKKIETIRHRQSSKSSKSSNPSLKKKIK